MATSAWAETIHLDCLFEGDITLRLAFVPTKAGKVSAEQWREGLCVSKPCMKEGSFTRTEGLYKFYWQMGSGVEEILELNRKELTYKHQFLNSSFGYMSPSYGVCKIVQRANKNNKI